MKNAEYSWEIFTKHVSYYVSGKTLQDAISNFNRQWSAIAKTKSIVKVQRLDCSELFKWGEAINKKYFDSLKRKSA